MDPLLVSRIGDRLGRLYGSRGAALTSRLLARMEHASAQLTATACEGWNQQDVVLITYADQIRSLDQSPLVALREFLLDYDLAGVINTVHLLPFYPFSSDDGFSVIDYHEVDPTVGSWDDVDSLGLSFRLMFDLVLNHISQQSDWFQAYLRGESPYDRFFIETDPAADFSQVVRPRSLPLLTTFDTTRGPQHVWTTFSADQVDLNFDEPEVLLAIVDVLLLYVSRGARIVRLDAVAYLWKQLGTSCIHLPQTHEVVKLLRDVLQGVSPGTLILTETNVPHAENISYFGQGDEAQMVYQFSLPPLLLDAVLQEDARAVSDWLSGLSDPLPGTTYFNFTASHDGIGVRPLEGLVSPERVGDLVRWTRQQQGQVSTRRQSSGEDVPYELNVTYVDALADPDGDIQLHARRFLGSQAVMLGLRGTPGVYFHSLVGTQNDLAGAQVSGQPRRINRRKFERAELVSELQRSGSLQQRIFNGYRQLLAHRRSLLAFHPDAAQRTEDVDDRRVLAFRRTATDASSEVLVLWNVSGQIVQIALPPTSLGAWQRDLISDLPVDSTFRLDPYQAAWILA